MRSSSPPPDAPTSPPAQRPVRQPVARTPRWLMITILAAVVVLVGVGVLVLALRQQHPQAAPQPDRSVAAARQGRQSADFSVVNGITSITVRTADIGDDMYRITAPGNANLAPKVDDNGDHIQLSFTPVQGQPTNSVQVLLNPQVRWKLHLVGGATTANVDLRTADLAGLDFTTGVTRIEVWLPAPKGTVAVSLSGGASDILIHAANPGPAQVRVTNGAGSLVIDGTTRSGVSGGTVVTPPGWDKSTDRYDVTIAAGVGNFTLDRY